MLDRQGRQGDEELLTAKDAEGAKNAQQINEQ